MPDQAIAEIARFVPPRPESPPQPLSFPRFLRTVRHNAIAMWPVEAYENDVAAQSFLGRTRLLLNQPDAIRQVLVDNVANYRRTAASIRILRPIAGDGLLLSEGEDWRLQRRTIAPALAPRVIPMLTRHIAAAAEARIARLRSMTGGPVDLLAEMQSLALDIAGRSMFSMEMDRHGAAMRAMLTEYGQTHARPHMLDLLLPISIPSPRDLGRYLFKRRWMALIGEIMEARLAAPAEGASTDGTPRDLFDLLLAARDPETGQGFTRTELRDQVATLILAGHETTAVTLFWALTLLAQAPDAQDWLEAEVAEMDFSPDAAAATLAMLTRTRAMVSETLRLYPPAFTLVREAIGPDRAVGIEIPRGAMVMIAPWVLHRHRKLWAEPDVFDPRRFLPGAPPPARYAYLPFGTGPRVCVGAQFALAEAALVLGAMVQAFRVRLEGTRPVLPAGVVTTQPDHAPPFLLEVR